MPREGVRRMVASAFLTVVAAVGASIAYGSLRWLWAGERDNSIANYLLYGVPSLIVAAVALFALVRMWRHR